MTQEQLNIIYFDLETQTTYEELGIYLSNDKIPSKLKVSIAGILFNNKNSNIYNHKFFGESNIKLLIQNLKESDLIIGHNLLNFDYQVLQQYTNENIYHILSDKTFDTMLELNKYTNGCWTSLDDLCRLNLGEGKTHSGALTPKMWRDGKFKDVEEYLLNDLTKTKDIYQYIKKNKRVKYTHKHYGEIIGVREVMVNW